MCIRSRSLLENLFPMHRCILLVALWRWKESSAIAAGENSDSLNTKAARKYGKGPSPQPFPVGPFSDAGSTEDRNDPRESGSVHLPGVFPPTVASDTTRGNSRRRDNFHIKTGQLGREDIHHSERHFLNRAVNGSFEIPGLVLGKEDGKLGRIEGHFWPSAATEVQRNRRLPAAGDHTLADCRVFVNFSDVNNDGNLDQNEYTVLVNLLQDDGDPVNSFDRLPIPLQAAFDSFALGGLEIKLLEGEENGGDEMNSPIVSFNVFQHVERHGISRTQICSDVVNMMDNKPATLASGGSYLNTRQINIPGIPTPGQGGESGGDGSCEFLVNFDVIIQYAEDEFLACDSSAQEESISQSMVDAMNTFAAAEGFSLTFPENPTLFWDDQEVNNLAPFRRSLQQKRELQLTTCSARLESESCTPEVADYCRWSCLTAEADCAEVTTETFSQMEDDVTEALRAEAASPGNEIDCLGIPNELMVKIRAEETAGRQTPTTNITSSPSLSQTMNTTAPSVSQSMNTTAPTVPQSMNTTAPTLPQSMNTTAPTVPPQLRNTTAPTGSQAVDTNAPTVSQSLNTTAPTVGPTINTGAPIALPTFESTSQPTSLPQISPPTISPSLAPVARETLEPTLKLEPTVAPNTTQEIVTGHNSWIMSNSIGLSADDMTGDLGFAEIQRAYRSFTADIVSGMSVSRPARSRLRRRRRLEVTLQPGTPDVYMFVDSVCPSSAAENLMCLTAFGKVDLIVVGEDSEQVYNEYVDVSQIAIDTGLLQESLNEVAAGSLWTIEQSSLPVTPSIDVTEPPIVEDEEEDRGGTDLILGLIASGAVAIVLVIIVCLFVIMPQLRRNRDVKQAKKQALEALREAEARDKAAAESMARSFAASAKPVKPKKRCKPPKTLHDEGDNPYREEVEQLINENCPDMIEELDSLLHQYQGREEDLIALLRDFKTESLLDEDSLVDISWDSDSLLSSESESLRAEVPPIDEVEMAAASKAIVAETVDEDKSDEELLSEASSKASEVEEENRALEPPDSSDAPLEPPELKSLPPSEESFESESEPETETAPLLEPEPVREPEPEIEQPKKAPIVVEDGTNTTDEQQTMESDFLSTSSDESSEGYQIRWIKRNGYWMKKRVWLEDQWYDEPDYDSSDDESEARQQFRWVKEDATNKFVKAPVVEERMLVDDDSYISSSSSDSDGELPKFVLKNGQWTEIRADGYARGSLV